MSIAIEARELCFAYGDRAVLDGLDFHVDAGEIFGLVGADGAGKTTLLRLAAGQLTGARGTLRVLDRETTDPALRRQLAYMPQGFGLYRDLSVAENLQFFSDLHGLSAAEARRHTADLLARTGLHGFEHRRAGQLSGGMMQKLALACALVSKPRVMFLDEPTTGVDPIARRAFWRLLDAVRAEGVAILYSTANMSEAERCDRVGLLQGGRLDLQGAPAVLLSREGAGFVEIVGDDARALRSRLRSIEGICLLYPVGRRVHAWIDAGLTPERLEDQLAPLGLSSSQRRPSLHDVALRALASAEPARGAG